MSYSLCMLWYDRQRFFAAILAVAFSVILICMQFGLLLGMFALTSIPIDHSRADIWLGSPGVVSVDVGKPVPESYMTWVAQQPEIERTETYVMGFNYWERPDGGAELCIVVGSRLAPNSLGAVSHLTPQLRSQLTEPGAIVVDRSELSKLGINGIGDTALIRKKKVRVVGLVNGLSSLQGPYVFCSIQTARNLLPIRNDQITYVLGKCRNRSQTESVAASLRRKSPRMAVMSNAEFSTRSRVHWLTKTKGGIAVGFAAALGLLVGAVITRQSLYAATIAMIREYAVLRALGIPRWRLAWNVSWLAFWVGLVGIAVAMPALFLLMRLGSYFYVPIQMPWWLLVAAISITWLVAILAGLTTLRSVQRAEPVTLLR